MHNVGFSQNLKSLEEILEVTECLLLLELSIHFDLLLKSAPIAVLIDKVIIVGSLEYFDKPDNMSGVLYLAESLYLIDGELFKFGTNFKLFYFDDLDGNNLISLLINSPINFTKLPFPYNIIKNIILYFLSHCLLIFMNCYYNILFNNYQYYINFHYSPSLLL